MERVLRYLKGTLNVELHYLRIHAVLEGICDANWNDKSDETKAASDYVFLLGFSLRGCCSVLEVCQAYFVILVHDERQVVCFGLSRS